MPNVQFQIDFELNNLLYYNINNMKQSIIFWIFHLCISKDSREKNMSTMHQALKHGSGMVYPDIESFETRFKKILFLLIILHYKSFLFEQLNRTNVRRKKVMRFGIIENANCPKCNKESTTEHAIFHCYSPKFFIISLMIMPNVQFQIKAEKSKIYTHD